MKVVGVLNPQCAQSAVPSVDKFTLDGIAARLPESDPAPGVAVAVAVAVAVKVAVAVAVGGITPPVNVADWMFILPTG